MGKTVWNITANCAGRGTYRVTGRRRKWVWGKLKLAQRPACSVFSAVFLRLREEVAVEGAEETRGEHQQRQGFESLGVVAETGMKAPEVVKMDEEANGDVGCGKEDPGCFRQISGATAAEQDGATNFECVNAVTDRQQSDKDACEPLFETAAGRTVREIVDVVVDAGGWVRVFFKAAGSCIPERR